MIIPYRIFTQLEAEAEISEKEQTGIFFKDLSRQAFLIIQPFYREYESFNQKIFLGNFEFFALTAGWEKFTPTGYKSSTFYHSNSKEYQKHNEEFLLNEFKKILEKYGVDVVKGTQISLL